MVYLFIRLMANNILFSGSHGLEIKKIDLNKSDLTPFLYVIDGQIGESTLHDISSLVKLSVNNLINEP